MELGISGELLKYGWLSDDSQSFSAIPCPSPSHFDHMGVNWWDSKIARCFMVGVLIWGKVSNCWKSDDFREGRREGRGKRVFLGIVASLSRELVTFGSVLDEGWMILVCFG